METIFVIGDAQRISEFQARTAHITTNFQYIEEGKKLPDLRQAKVLFDLTLDENHQRLAEYASLPDLFVIAAAVKYSLAEMAASQDAPLLCKLAGINALPTFLEKKNWEISLWNESSAKDLKALLDTWEIPFQLVDDRVGMVTPRLLFMIINEACFTVQEGTAAALDIDQAMRLGVNYPGGPFEWADKIGVNHIYEVLMRLREDSTDSRYKVAPLLKKHYLRKQSFYPIQ